MRDAFFDGIREDANRTNRASGRSWHIPEDREPSKPALFLAVVAVILIGLALIGAIDGML